jgi:N-acetyltransferase
MQLSFCPLEGRFVRLEPFSPQLKEQVRLAIDCDPGTWAIMPINPMGERFEEYWNDRQWRADYRADGLGHPAAR